VEIEYAIMLTKMMNGAQPGYKVQGMTVEVISEYNPVMIPDDEEMEEYNGDYT